MSGICRKCGGETTHTRANSEKGLCFSCEHGLERPPKTTPSKITDGPETRHHLAMAANYLLRNFTEGHIWLNSEAEEAWRFLVFLVDNWKDD